MTETNKSLLSLIIIDINNDKIKFNFWEKDVHIYNGLIKQNKKYQISGYYYNTKYQDIIMADFLFYNTLVIIQNKWKQKNRKR